ncbi:hypothetical protein KFX46_08035 [Macrococcus canis]|uniref:hypothetical protein n=1 Tax=Macrococcoides canis TaxID=1855823 RepID=UPI00207C780C|nr:hypothetical protein [Macrococcus canis]MCO4096955.1 hypothetical protein [Macrococcus canis]
MKKILPILLIFILIVSACSGEKQEKKKDTKKESNQIVEADGTLNLKNYLHKKGNVAFLVRNTDGSQTLNEETKVEAIIVSKGKEMQVFNTGYEMINSALLKDINKKKSNNDIAVLGADFDKEIFKIFVNEVNTRHKRDTDKQNELDGSRGKETHVFEPINLEYNEPSDRKIDYSSGENIKGESAVFINAAPRQLINITNPATRYKPGIEVDKNTDQGYNFSDYLPLTKVNNKKYIGLSTISDDHNEARMIIVEAPKGTKKISSGL